MTSPPQRDSDTPADLAADTAVYRDADEGHYRGVLPGSWDFQTPSGGVLTTSVLRAMRDVLGDTGLRLRSSTTVFCRPVPAGPYRVTVEVLRRGNVAAQLRGALWPDEDRAHAAVGLEVQATFARTLDGPDATFRRFPDDVPGPADCDDFLGPRLADAPPFLHQVECRLAVGARWWEAGWQAGDARYARWFRYRKPQQTGDGHLDPFAIPPLADTMPAAVVAGLGPSSPRRLYPSLDLTLHYLGDTDAEWLLVQARGVRAMDGYASAEVDVWDPSQRLVAYGSQTMLVRRSSPRDRAPRT